MDRIDIQYKIEAKDIFDTMAADTKKSFFKIQNILFYVGIFTIGLPFVFSSSSPFFLNRYLLSFTLGCINYIALYFIRLGSYKNRAKQVIAYHSIFSKKQKAEITAEGITMYPNDIKEHTKWSDFLNVLEYKNSFIIAEKNGLANIIPKSLFSDEQLETFRSWTKGIKVKHQEFSDNNENDSWEYVDSDE